MRDINELMSIYKTICKSLKASDKENSELNNYDNFKEVFSKEEFDQIVNCKKNRSNKRRRTSNKIRELVHYLWNIKPSKNQEFNLIFGTATLNEKYIKLQERTKAKLIDIWLKRHFIRALVNKDFGDRTEREHYHFIAITKEPIEKTDKLSKKGFPLYKLLKKDYKMGHEPVIEIINWQDMDKLRNYLLKLNNHSNKITTRNRLRDIKSCEWELYEFFNGNKAKKANKRKTKNATYDVLNKKSTSKVAEEYVLTEEEIFELFSD